MSDRPDYVPEGYRAVSPYLIVPDADGLVRFLERTFDGEERHRTTTPEGRVIHVEVRIADSVVMMGEAGGESSPRQGSLYVFVEDVDATYRRALEAGASSVMEPADQFYGDRNGGVEDPWGNLWWIGTRVEDVSEEEMARRLEAMGQERS